MNHTLIQYLRNSDRSPYGVVVASIRPTDNKVGIGFSAVRPNSGDKFDRDMGIRIATGRAAVVNERARKDATFAGLKKHNPEVYGAIYSMYNRARDYFVDKEVVLP